MGRQYVVAKYVDDLARNEPLNVGIVIFEGQEWRARFFGESLDGGFKLSRLGKRVPTGRKSFRGWVKYWRQALADPARANIDASSPQEVVEALMQLERGNLYLEHGGSVLLDESDESLDQMLSRLYDRLVVTPREESADIGTVQMPTRPLHEVSLERLKLAGAPVDDPARFKPKFPVQLVFGDMSDTEEVSYAVMNGAWHYVQEVEFDAHNPRQSKWDVHHAALVIGHADVAETAVFLYDGAQVTEATRYLIDILGGVAPAVDVSDEASTLRLRDELKLG